MPPARNLPASADRFRAFFSFPLRPNNLTLRASFRSPFPEKGCNISNISRHFWNAYPFFSVGTRSLFYSFSHARVPVRQ